MTLQDKLDAMREDFEDGRFPLVPTSEQLKTMQRAIQSLIDSGQVDDALKAGDTAPEFTLGDADANSVSSRALLARGPIVATFYRGVWCPYGQTHNYFSSTAKSLTLGARIPGYLLVNLRAGISDEAGWSLAGIVKNVFDKTYYSGGVGFANIFSLNTAVPGVRRTWMLEASYKF